MTAGVEVEAKAAERDVPWAGSPYQSYVYAYPHKTAYRYFDRPVPLGELWASEVKDAPFLYVHVPFCEMRCGFCNLFTTVRPEDDVVERYVTAVERQARVVRSEVGPMQVARFAVGGGTPSYLGLGQLARVFDLAEQVMGADVAAIPCSVEVSPETASPDKLALLAERGVDRVSMGVQSFFPAEVESVFRRQDNRAVDAALRAMGRLGFPVVNVDLMYGLPGQTPASFIQSIDQARGYGPAELYLYPLYVRPLTRMASADAVWDDERLACYRAGRDHLRGLGWTQVSMRMFRAPEAPSLEGPVYRCQEDGMVGLGCGARTYTSRLHHSSAYAVGPMKVKEIIQNYNVKIILKKAFHKMRSDKTATACNKYMFHLHPSRKNRRVRTGTRPLPALSSGTFLSE